MELAIDIRIITPQIKAVRLRRLWTKVEEISCKDFGSCSNSSAITSTDVATSKIVANARDVITI